MRIYDKLTLSISLLSLSVSIFVAYKQFEPVKDTLTIEGNLGFSKETPLSEVYKKSMLTTFFGKNKTLAGPFVLKLTLSNNLSRTVSVKNVNVTTVLNDKWTFVNSTIRNEDKDKIQRIVKIEGNGVERVFYQVNLPILMTVQTRSCLDNNSGEKGFNAAIDKCYYDKNLDIFGNEIKYIKHGDTKILLASKLESLPSVKVRLTTGDNTVIEKIIGFEGLVPTF